MLLTKPVAFVVLTALSLVPTPATLAAALGLLPFFPSQCSVGQAGPGLESVQEKHLATVGVIEGGLSGPQPCLQSFASLAARGLQAVQPRQPPQKQPAGAASEVRTQASTHVYRHPLGQCDSGDFLTRGCPA